MDSFWERVFWIVMTASLAGIGWLARSILKPWSDAALMRSRAFVDMVAVLQASVPPIKDKLNVLEEASRQSNEALDRNTRAAEAQTTTFREWAKGFGSDPKKLCMADSLKEQLATMGWTVKNFEELLQILRDIRTQGKEAADTLADKAILIATVEPKDSPYEAEASPGGSTAGGVTSPVKGGTS